MTVRYSSEIDTFGARRQKMTAFRRPLIVGALAAGVIALGASTAVAAGPLGSPSPGPSTVWGQGTSSSMMKRYEYGHNARHERQHDERHQGGGTAWP
jgi:hypothetical protein